MDYYLLTDLAAQVGHGLAISGAETFRVEDTIRRILHAYGIECEVFAIPNCLTISFEAANGKPLTIMKRIGFHGNDLDAVEQFNALSRRICRETPEVEVAMQWLEETQAACRRYSLPVYYLGHYLGAFGYCFVFGGTLRDSLWAGLLGLIIGLVNGFLNRLEVNPFRTIAASFFMAAPAYLAASLGWMDSVDSSIIGALMILVPGLLITNSMRDIIYGDTNSGINRIVQVLSAFAIALGTAAAWRITSGAVRPAGKHRCGASLLGAGSGGAGGLRGLRHPLQRTRRRNVAVYAGRRGHVDGILLAQQLGYGVYSMNFFATLVAAPHAETMARIRKYPVTSYLVVSTFPLLPGAGIYYTMSLGLAGDFHAALAKGLETAGIAGCLAVGILLVSTLFRLPAEWKRRHGKN